jgi:sulfate/thiosulfate transport system substrate-binding protein
MKRFRFVSILAVAAMGLGILVPAASARLARTTDAKLTLVAYSTPREAYAKIIPAFQKTPQGSGVSFDQSYGASGEQARAVLTGLNADVVAFSLEPDMTSLVNRGLVAKSWNQGFYKGMVSNSVVVFVVRDGNPKKIKTWNDLTKPGVEVITPNPATSGGAKWNVMAAYGGMLKQGKTPKQAVDYLGKLLEHISVQDKSAREALQTFLSGKGDVLLAYENEAFFARLKKQPVQWVIPRATILIENPVAITTTTKNPKEAQAFVNFLRTPEAQRIYGENGYRPVVKSVAKDFNYPSRPALFTIQLFGGWSKVDKKFFDPRTGIYTQLQRKAGKS